MSRRHVLVLAVLCAVFLEEGFLAAAVRYSVKDLGTLPGYNSFTPSGINASGQVVGNARIAGLPDSQAFYYDGNTITALPSTSAIGINASGQIACKGGIYSGGTMISIGTLGNGQCTPHGINDYGNVVGSGYTSSGDEHAFLYSGGILTDLRTLGGNYSTANEINNNGQIVGCSTTASGSARAFLYSGGIMSDLGTLAGGNWSEATFINASGQIVGIADIGNGDEHAFLYSGGMMKDLGTPPGGATSLAFGINSSGTIVGYWRTAGRSVRAFVYSDGTMTDLNSLIDPAAGWALWYANAINDSGQIIVAGGGGQTGGTNHALLLTPIPEPSALSLLGIGVIGILGYLWRRHRA
jgi:probable HAF family extracellular repeat protein